MTTTRPAPKPFTVDHFKRWIGNLILDSGDHWSLEPFQLEVVEEILRGTQEVWLDVPEGCGKTTLMGGLALYHGNYTPDAMVPMAASSRDQTRVLFGQAAGFVRRTPGLDKRFVVQEGFLRIKCLRTGGRIQVFAADDKTGDGIIPSLALVEELHRHADLRLYRTWRGKLEKRGGQLVTISTAGEPGAEYETVKAEILKAAAARGTVEREGAHTTARTPDFVLHQHALREGDDVHDLDLVKQANPFSGVTIEGLRRKHDSPTFTLEHWARFSAGVPMRGERAAIAAHEWNALPRLEIEEGERVAVGADFGWMWDTTALVPFLKASAADLRLGPPEVIVPPRDGTSTDPEEIREAFRRIHARTPIDTVVMDESQGGAQMAEFITGELRAEVIPYPSTNAPQAEAFERFMEAIREGWLSHPHDETFTAHVLNAVSRPTLGDRRRFDRPKATRAAKGQDQRVVDALIAASIVLATITAMPSGEAGSAFEILV